METKNYRVVRFDDAEKMAAAVADLLIEHVQPSRGKRALMLSGGSTPMAAYARVTQAAIAADPDVHVLLSDDRFVPWESDKNNQKHIAPMFDALGISPERRIPIQTELPIDDATRTFDARLAGLIDDGVAFEFGLLGMGADGHTAGIFNDEQLAAGKDAHAIAVQRPDAMEGITATPNILQRFKKLVYLVCGESKHPPLRDWITGSAPVVAEKATREAPLRELWVDTAAWGDLPEEHA